MTHRAAPDLFLQQQQEHNGKAQEGVEKKNRNAIAPSVSAGLRMGDILVVPERE